MAYKIFIDSDVILDLFLAREPHLKYAQELLSLYDVGDFQLYTSAIIVNNAYYFIKKDRGNENARSAISLITELLQILPVDADGVRFAIDSKFKDFEDALQYYTALKHRCNYIITRNIKDYKSSGIPVLTAEQFLKTL
jgi:predicted nucleic acid-binding protein